MTAHNGNPANSPKPAQCDRPGCYVWTPHDHYGANVTLSQYVGHEETTRLFVGQHGQDAFNPVRRDRFEKLAQRAKCRVFGHKWDSDRPSGPIHMRDICWRCDAVRKADNNLR